MRRRTILGLVGSGSILGLGFANRGKARSISISDQSDQPDSIPLHIRVQMERDRSTYQNPARLSVSIDNQSDEDITISAGKPAVFSHQHSTPSDPGVQLKPRRWDWQKHPLCIKELRQNNISTEMRTETIKSDGSISGEFEVWGLGSNDLEQCIPNGVYRFESQYRGAMDPEQFHEWGFNWGFELEITE